MMKMNTDEVVEKLMECVLDKLLQMLVDVGMDDLEYVREVKASLAALDTFFCENKGICDNPEAIKQSLYSYAKKLWMNLCEQNRDSHDTDDEDSEDQEYSEYYFDYMFAHGKYPR